MRRFLLACCLFMSSLAVLAQAPQSGVEALPEWTKPQIERIRTMAQAMKQCKAVTDQIKLQKKAIITETMNIPVSVIWDISPSNSLRAPYTAYIEGVVGHHLEGNPDCHKLAGCLQTLSFVNSSPAMVKRFEFDISPDGLSFRRKLSRKENETDWTAEQVREDATCWDDVVLSSKTAKPNEN